MADYVSDHKQWWFTVDHSSNVQVCRMQRERRGADVMLVVSLTYSVRRILGDPIEVRIIFSSTYNHPNRISTQWCAVLNCLVSKGQTAAGRKHLALLCCWSSLIFYLKANVVL